MTSGIVPPHDLDAEASTLGNIMLEPSMLLRIRPILGDSGRHYYSEANGTIYAAMVALSDAGLPLDVVQLRGWLHDRQALARVGGAAYLAQLMDTAAYVLDIEPKARRVRDLSVFRQLGQELHRAAAATYDPADAGNPYDFAGSIVERISTLAGSASADRGEDIGRILERQMVAWQEPHKDQRIRVRTGIRALDKILRPMRSGHLVTIGAHSGRGKTSLGKCLAAHAVLNTTETRCPTCNELREDCAGQCPECGTPLLHLPSGVLVFTTEMMREEWAESVHFGVARVDTSKMDEERRHLLTAEEWHRLAQVASPLARAPMRIVDDAHTMPDVRAVALRYKAEQARIGKPLRLVVLDYLQRFQRHVDDARRARSRREEVGDDARAAKNLAKQLHVPVVLLAQLNQQARKEKRRPTAWDLGEANIIEQESDKIILIYNEAADARALGEAPEDSDPYEPDPAELIVAKNRGGRTGTAQVAFYRYCTSFDDWPDNRTWPSDRQRG